MRRPLGPLRPCLYVAPTVPAVPSANATSVTEERHLPAWSPSIRNANTFSTGMLMTIVFSAFAMRPLVRMRSWYHICPLIPPGVHPLLGHQPAVQHAGLG